MAMATRPYTLSICGISGAVSDIMSTIDNNAPDIRGTAEVPEETAKAYLRGESFPFEGDKGWYIVHYRGISLGWGKCTGGIMKNHYPKGLRKNL